MSRAATETDARVLRLLRLAFVSAWTLAAGAAVAHLSRRVIRKRRARRFEGKPHSRKSEQGSRISERRRPREFRTAVRISMAVATLRRAARMGGSTGAGNVDKFEAARRCRCRAIENVVAKTFASGAHRRARSNRLRAWA